MFITIDGPDGAGKTTVAKKLVEQLNSQDGGNSAIYTSEPTTGALGQEIRRILNSGKAHEMTRLTDYFLRDRAEHVAEIQGLLSEGYTVICDRYKYSTIVYQQLQGESPDKLIELNRAFLRPDCAVILNVENVDTLLAHISQRGASRDLFEARETLLKVIGLYNKMTEYFPDENIRLINADRDIDVIVREIMAVI